MVKKAGVVLGNLQPTPNRLAQPNSPPTLLNTNQPAILAPSLATKLDDPHRNLKVEIIHIAAENLGPETAAAALATPVPAPDIAGGERVDADRVAHARKLGAECRVRLYRRAVLQREGVQERLEDGELGLERGQVALAEVCAVGGVRLAGLIARCEGA